MKEIEFTYKIYDNIIEITPVEPIKDNYVYTVEIEDVQSSVKKIKTSIKEQVYTGMSPSYCSMEGVLSLVESIDLPEDKTLYYIREASRKAEYLSGQSYDENNTPFQVNQFVRYRAAYDTLLRFSIDRASRAGLKGVMGEIQFETSDSKDPLADLLKSLKGEADEWEKQLLGDDFNKGAAPKAAMFRANPGFYHTKVSTFGREVTR